MIWQSRKFAGLVLSVEVALIIVYTFFVTYDEDAKGPKINGSATKVPQERNSIQDYYPKSRLEPMTYLVREQMAICYQSKRNDGRGISLVADTL
ncbi:hypothetical protein NPIL_355611 [Nephila pilipes]|uniref:Uncharacterized protein n=1 Tax=Nephila pilipes TaxID=299642 RepID=A0A8X6QNL7_NEPPI|nr:hypothetical protein NPIL_355611 [Nephila pilipes]